MITGDELRDAREISANLSQRELAELLGVSPRTVGNWERSEVPRKREGRVMRLFGGHIESIRRGAVQMAQHDEWAASPQGQAWYETQAELMEDAARQDEDPIGFWLQQAPDSRLLEELAQRLARTATADVSQDSYTLAASDADIDAEVEAQQDEA